MTNKRIVSISVGVGILVAGTLSIMLISGQRSTPEKITIPKTKKYVKTKEVSYRDIKTEIEAYGRVRTAESLDLLSEVSGRMFQGRIKLKEGQAFRKGTLLFYIDPVEAELSLKADKSNFLKDLAAILPDLRLDFSDNYQNWQEYFSKINLNKDLPALPEVKSDKEKTFLATRGIYSAYYAIKGAEVRLKKHRYYAPFDGSVTEVNIQSGSFVNPGNKIGRIIRRGKNELQLAVETSDAVWLERGAPATIYSDDTQQSWSGEVIRIGDYVNENTQSVDVFLSIFPNENKIYDGQFMRGTLPSRTLKGGMLIPRNIIYNGNEVFILNDTIMNARKINVLRTDKEMAIINGLEPGSDLIYEPLVNAHNGLVAYPMEQREIDLVKKEVDLANAQKETKANNTTIQTN